MSETPEDRYQRVKQVIIKLNEPAMVWRHMEEGGTFQELLNLNETDMQSLYEDAYTLLQTGEHANAADAFLCLTTLNPYVSSYWIGLGFAEQSHRACYGALVAYAMAIVCDDKNPVPYYYAASCHYLNDDFDEALSSVQLAIEKSKDNPSYSEIHARAITSQANLLDKKKRIRPVVDNTDAENDKN